MNEGDNYAQKQQSSWGGGGGAVFLPSHCGFGRYSLWQEITFQHNNKAAT